MSKRSSFDVYVEEAKHLEKIYRDPWVLLQKLAEVVKKYIPDAEIYLFGSIARGRYTLASDIDVLVVSDLKDKLDIDRVKAYVKKQFLDIPIQLHIVNRREYREWYLRFIKKEESIRID